MFSFARLPLGFSDSADVNRVYQQVSEVCVRNFGSRSDLRVILRGSVAVSCTSKSRALLFALYNLELIEY